MQNTPDHIRTAHLARSARLARQAAASRLARPSRRPRLSRAAHIAAAASLSAAAVAGAATPAHAAVPATQGYGWLTRWAGGALTSYSSNGKPVTLTTLGPGHWRATFQGLPGFSGAPMATPGNAVPGASCAVDKTVLIGRNGRTDRDVEFHCSDGDGKLKTMDATVSFTSVAGGNEAWATSADADGKVLATAYDWIGGKVDATRTAGGFYPITFEGFNGGFVFPEGIALSTAMTSTPGIKCRPVDTYLISSLAVANTVCHDASLSLVNTPLAVHYVRNRGIFADPSLASGYLSVDPSNYPTGVFVAVSAPAGWTSNAQLPQVKRTGVGTYVVKFPGLKGSKRMAHVEAAGNFAYDPRCAGVATGSGADGLVTVTCSAASGLHFDNAFVVAYSARP